MNREKVSENVKRRLYAESMGRCMNPNCREDLFIGGGDIAEKAHMEFLKKINSLYLKLK